MDKLVENFCFWKIWIEFKCFWKTFNLILMHFIHEILCFKEFLHKITLFLKNLSIQDFRPIEFVARPIENTIKNLVWIYLARLVLNWYSIDWIYFSIDQSLILTNRNSVYECFKKELFSRVLHFIQTFQALHSYFSSTYPI